MIGHPQAWRDRKRSWLSAAAFFVVNALVFGFYLINYAGEGAGLERRLTRVRGDLATVETRVSDLESSLAVATQNDQNVADFYEARLATEEERLTAIIAEVKRLARVAGLDPRRISYPTEEIADFGLVKRSMTFSVSGTYAQLRRLINLLELSDYFLTLRRVELRGADDRGSALRIQLEISTLFAMDPEDTAPATDARRGRSG